MVIRIQQEESSLGSNSQTAAVCRTYDTYPNNSLCEYLHESYVDDNYHSSCHDHAHGEF